MVGSYGTMANALGGRVTLLDNSSRHFLDQGEEKLEDQHHRFLVLAATAATFVTTSGWWPRSYTSHPLCQAASDSIVTPSDENVVERLNLWCESVEIRALLHHWDHTIAISSKAEF